jgi:lysophospholipase L1-like esterase
MEFRTKVNLPEYPFRIAHTDQLLLMGSCFTENIGNYLTQHQFQANVNPFGIIYNPLSIFANLNHITDKKHYTQNDLLLHNELYCSPDHHGHFSGTDKAEVLNRINASVEKAHADFNTANVMVITLGTAYVYRHLEQNRVVANCHKLPGTAFEKRLLTIEEIKTAFAVLTAAQKNKKIIFTVSPVRHWRDGAVQNQRSKSILIESIHQLTAEHNNCFYFPAYEIMMDELRDYRFYAEDMLHPNATAVSYIWQRFADAFFDAGTKHINAQTEKINLLLQHRVKNTGTQAQAAFEEKLNVQ